MGHPSLACEEISRTPPSLVATLMCGVRCVVLLVCFRRGKHFTLFAVVLFSLDSLFDLALPSVPTRGGM